MKRLKGYIFCIIFVFSALTLHAADPKADLSDGQVLYVPAYSHIYFGNKERPYLLTVTLSIRNIDPSNSLEVSEIGYYESEGKLEKKLIEKPVLVKPFESIRYVIPEKDKSGGSGANFLIKWKSPKLINPPIVESIMIGTQGQHGISFTSRGREIVTP